MSADNTPWGDNSRNIYNLTILSKPLLDPTFDVEPVFEGRFDSKSRLEGVLVKTLRTFQATPVKCVRTDTEVPTVYSDHSHCSLNAPHCSWAAPWFSCFVSVLGGAPSHSEGPVPGWHVRRQAHYSSASPPLASPARSPGGSLPPFGAT